MASKAYLAKYLSGPSTTSDYEQTKPKKKKRKSKSSSIGMVKVIDEDNEDWKKQSTLDDEDGDEDDIEEMRKEMLLKYEMEQKLKAKRARAAEREIQENESKREMDEGGSRVDRYDSESDHDKRRRRHDSDSEDDIRRRHDSESEEDRGRRRHDSDTDDDELKSRTDKTKHSKQADENAVHNTIYRDKYGRKIAAPTKESKEEQERKTKLEKEEEERKRREWNMGRKQREQLMMQRQRMIESRDEGFTGSKDDRIWNEKLKSEVRWGDPSAVAASTKTRKQKKSSRPVYQGHFPPNRFNIKPGFRWDGVDRSNGFERDMFLQQNQRIATAEAAYKWSTEDM